MLSSPTAFYLTLEILPTYTLTYHLRCLLSPPSALRWLSTRRRRQANAHARDGAGTALDGAAARLTLVAGHSRPPVPAPVLPMARHRAHVESERALPFPRMV